jgi:hypothetical protein
MIDGVQQSGDLFPAENAWQSLGSFAVWQLGDHALTRTGYLIEEAEGANGLVGSGPGNPFHLHEMQKILIDLIGRELVGPDVEVGGELSEVLDVGLDGSWGTVTALQILDKALT